MADGGGSESSSEVDTMADTDTDTTTSLSPSPQNQLECHPFSKRVPISSILSTPDGGASFAGQTVTVAGWVRTRREQGEGKFAFLKLTDGSCAANLQVIVDSSVYELSRLVHTGTSLTVVGVLKTPPDGTQQKVELRVDQVLELGPYDPTSYPLPKTRLTLSSYHVEMSIDNSSAVYGISIHKHRRRTKYSGLTWV